MSVQTGTQHELLWKLASVTDSIEGYKATIFMLERERLQLQTQLRLAGYKPPVKQDASE